MKEAVVREKLLELCETLHTSSGSGEEPGDGNQGMYVPEMDAQIDGVIDQLRLQIKYLMFDLEASRRENRYLRQMLEMRPPQPRKDRRNDEPNW